MAFDKKIAASDRRRIAAVPPLSPLSASDYRQPDVSRHDHKLAVPSTSALLSVRMSPESPVRVVSALIPAEDDVVVASVVDERERKVTSATYPFETNAAGKGGDLSSTMAWRGPMRKGAPWPDAIASGEGEDEDESGVEKPHAVKLTKSNEEVVTTEGTVDEEVEVEFEGEIEDEGEGASSAAATYRDYSRATLAESGTVDGDRSDDLSEFPYCSPSSKDPPFPAKLHRILANPAFSSILSWLPHGRAWKVLQPKAFEERVVPVFFRHCRYSSFMRQVNGWGFKRVSRGKDANAYYHELFLRGLPKLSLKMRRPASGGRNCGKSQTFDVADAGFVAGGGGRALAPNFYAISERRPLPEYRLTSEMEKVLLKDAERFNSTEMLRKNREKEMLVVQERASVAAPVVPSSSATSPEATGVGNISLASADMTELIQFEAIAARCQAALTQRSTFDVTDTPSSSAVAAFIASQKQWKSNPSNATSILSARQQQDQLQGRSEQEALALALLRQKKTALESARTQELLRSRADFLSTPTHSGSMTASQFSFPSQQQATPLTVSSEVDSLLSLEMLAAQRRRHQQQELEAQLVAATRARAEEEKEEQRLLLLQRHMQQTQLRQRQQQLAQLALLQQEQRSSNFFLGGETGAFGLAGAGISNEVEELRNALRASRAQNELLAAAMVNTMGGTAANLPHEGRLF